MNMKTSGTMTRKKMFYALLAVTVVVIALGVFMSQEKIATPGPDAARRAVTAGSLISPEPFHDFGNVSMAAGKVTHRFRIRNTGGAAATITKLYTSCMCTEATLITPTGRKGPFGMPGHGTATSIKERIAPGAEAQVEVVFDPAAHGPAGIGPNERIVSIKGGARQPLELRISAMVRP